MTRWPAVECVFVAIVLIAWPASAQTSGGIFRGEVHDPSGAVVPQAEITIRSQSSGTEVKLESNPKGLFVSPTLIPGAYTLGAAKVGFETEVFGPVVLEVNQTVRVDFALKLGAPSDSVDVAAAGEQLLSTESADVSQVIGNKQVAEIPLNGRSWQQLIDLSAGVNPGAPGESGSPNPVNINGQRTKANLYLVDGISTTSSMQGRGNDFDIPLEDVSEFSVQAGAYSAEYGNVAGGVINLQSRSGTNQWHGSLFEFFRNDAMDAANFFSNLTAQPKNSLRYNQFGGSIGGPIRRNKTFVFADYQGTLTHGGNPMITSVPLAAQRDGNFSGPGAPPIYNPFAPTYVRAPFANSTIPASLLDPAALRITALLPQPNQFGAAGNPLPFNNYAVTHVDTSNVESFDIRLDHQFDERNTIFARESFQNTSAFVPSIFGLPLGGSVLGAGATAARNQNAGIGFTSTINPSLLNEARLGLNRQTTALTQQDYGQNLSEQFGIPGFNTSPQTSGLSTMVLAGLFNVGGSLLTPLTLATTQWGLTDKITWVKGRHIIHAGIDYQHEMGSAGYLVYGRGDYTFLNLSTSSLVGPPGGNAFASFLLGAPFQILRDEFPPGLAGLLSYRLGFFLQDDFKVTPKFTVNLGARYDLMPYPREMYNRLSNFDPATGTMLTAGQNTSERLVNTDDHDLAPRVGLAYSANDKTVIRAGYGIGFIDPYGAAGALNSNEFNAPFYHLDNITQFPFTAPAYTLSHALPPLVMPSPGSPTGNQRYIVPNDPNQYSQAWSFTVQRALTPSLMFEVAYVGTSGVDLLTATNINAALPGTTNPLTRQPYGAALGEVRELSNSAHSIYHGLQSKVEKRFSRGLYFLGSYTWSKSIDDQSNGTDNVIASGQYPQDPYNAGLDRGPSSFDRPQVLTANAVWQIPFGRGSGESSRARELLNASLGGWQLSGIFTAQSGTPFSALMSCADINAQGNNCRPNLLAGRALPPDERSIRQWFDTSAFAIPSVPQYGTAGRNILRAPGLSNIDVALSKAFIFSSVETRRLQLRGEFFNALNHANFGIPVNSIDSPAFGSITSAGPAREIQLGARLEF